MKQLDPESISDAKFATFAEYAQELHSALCSFDAARLPNLAATALDGMPGRVLRSVVSASARRLTGTFFSGRSLAARLVEPYRTIIRDGATVVDPACGAGDLLLAAAEYVPHFGSLRTAADRWNRQLIGYDIDEAFAAVTRSRLLLLLRQKQSNWRMLSTPFHAFSNVQTGDSLASLAKNADFGDASILLLNPPFGAVEAPSDCEWGTGRVARAAVFTEAAVRGMPADAQIALILPDVLRSGVRYEKWRATMKKLMTIEATDVVGRFDRWTDVDVFIMRGIRRTHITASPATRKRGTTAVTVADKFDVSVGPVVPHRDPVSGPSRLFLHAKGLARFTTVRTINETRAYAGRVVDSPFVVIRRTSRPGDAEERAIATIIDVGEPVAVENHLIVAKPRDGRAETCEQLLRVLKSRQTTLTLNRRTRCRHLSVRFIKELRWRNSENE